jgi:hypothetical protein
MDYSTGKVLFIFLAAAILAVAGARLLAWRYRQTMRGLMSAPPRAHAAAPSAPTFLASRPAVRPARMAENRRSGWRVAALLILLSALISFSDAWLFLSVAMASEHAFSPKRWLTLGVLDLWPLIPSLGLLWRWSRWRVLGALGVWFFAAVALVIWRSIEPQPLSATLFVASEIGPPMVLIAALCMGGATRAIAPWLLPLFIALVWASIAGTDLLAWMVDRRRSWLMALPGWLSAYAVMAFFIAAPWLVAWWPAKRLGRALAAAYSRRWLSELIVLFGATWGIVLLARALGAASDLGLGGSVMLLPLLWIPLVMPAAAALNRVRERPPTLLVLRVFQRDTAVQALFDDIVERWRLTGNTVLIAGTDLVERTIDADDIFTFLDGRLGERFIHHQDEIGERLAGFELAPDAEGRYRVNEVYCHDTTWQQALDALVDASDVVLMDLRSVKTHNRGCRHELGVLARARRITRVVVLTDGDTDRADAQAAATGAPPGRFMWIDTARIDAARRRAILAALFVGDVLACEPDELRRSDAR